MESPTFIEETGAPTLLFALPATSLTLLVAFISGAIIMNCLIIELPSEKSGRF